MNALPARVVGPIMAFIEGALADNPRRVGKPLIGPFAGIVSARRGAYRVMYVIQDEPPIVTIVRVDHRADAYC